jgi:hypothetical protein
LIRNKSVFKGTFILIALFFLLSGSSHVEKANRMFMRSTFRPDKIEWTKKVLFKFKDAIPDDTLTIFYANPEQPVAFSRNIHTAVCSDTVCRLVNLTIYWEVTGKFLGYSVPGNEELTKKEHEPFLESDYTRLGEILADSSSLLGFYSPEEISPVKTTVVKADGITGATIPDLTSWIVSNAAYTSYTLWHLTYGSTRDSIKAYTRKHLLSKPLLIHLLQDRDPYNQIKAFQWINESKLDRNQFIDTALAVLHKGNSQVFGTALNYLKGCNSRERLQMEVVQSLGYEDFSVKIKAVEFLRESEKFSRPVALALLTFLWRDDYYLVNMVLALLEKRYVFEQNDLLKISSLLKSKNKNIANRVYYFLLSRNANNQNLTNNLNEYSKLYLNQ